MAQLIYPRSARLREIEQDYLPSMTAGDPILNDIFPTVTQDEYMLVWEQRDRYEGLMQVRGLNNAPPPVRPVGINQFSQVPGAYGEYLAIDERKLTVRRQIGSFGTPIDVSDLVEEGHTQLMDRDIKRQKYMGWTLATTGSYAAADRTNVIGHMMQFSPRVFNAAVPWSTFATATPLQDFRAIALGGRGTSSIFDAGATAYMNQSTFNNALNNGNSADLYGRRTQGLGTLNTMGMVTQLFLGENLPKVQIVEDGYYDEITHNFGLFIAAGKVVVVGRRPNGESVGNRIVVRNANNPNMEPGTYIRTIDKDIDATGPRTVEIHRGWSGGIVVRFPSAIYIMNV